MIHIFGGDYISSTRFAVTAVCVLLAYPPREKHLARPCKYLAKSARKGTFYLQESCKVQDSCKTVKILQDTCTNLASSCKKRDILRARILQTIFPWAGWQAAVLARAHRYFYCTVHVYTLFYSTSNFLLLVMFTT